MDIYIVNNSWGPSEANQIPLKQGDEMNVTLKDDSGWWWGKNLSTGVEGYFPGSFVSKKEVLVPPPFRGGKQGKRKSRVSRFSARLSKNNSITRVTTMEKREHARLDDIRKNQIDQADPGLKDVNEEDNYALQKIFTGRRHQNEIEKLKVNQNAKTIYCVVGHYQGYVSGITGIWLGWVAFKWGKNGLGAWTGIKFEEL